MADATPCTLPRLCRVPRQYHACRIWHICAAEVTSARSNTRIRSCANDSRRHSLTHYIYLLASAVPRSCQNPKMWAATGHFGHAPLSHLLSLLWTFRYYKHLLALLTSSSATHPMHLEFQSARLSKSFDKRNGPLQLPSRSFCNSHGSLCSKQSLVRD